jgi:hypothetical protein
MYITSQKALKNTMQAGDILHPTGSKGLALYRDNEMICWVKREVVDALCKSEFLIGFDHTINTYFGSTYTSFCYRAV